MGNKKVYEGFVYRNEQMAGDPATHFLYEFNGPRSVSPLVLINDGITLWHEAASTNEAYDISHLWGLAAQLLGNPGEPPMYSWIEWVRYQVITGNLVPKAWPKGERFPHKGLLISAVYLQEARRLCADSQFERAWHLISIAYYHLGQGTASSTVKNTARAAKHGHAERSADVRELVLIALEKISRDGSATTVNGAKDQVEKLIRELNNKFPEVTEALSKFDESISEKTKGRSLATVKNDVISRVRNLLDTWSLPSGPYPEIAEAFASFSKRRKRNATTAEALSSTTSEGIPLLPVDDFYIRFISHVGDDFDLVTKCSVDGIETTLKRR